ncbi:MAG: tetratricopeptide repeat protein, partial [Anaerolineae bacterium]|nr:tetratricopeptide repeat protein [Anaerolineae bacterium]
MTPYQVFLSYARKDDAENYQGRGKSLLNCLYDDLNAHQDKDGSPLFKAWWDKKDMPNRGESFSREIQTAIDRSQKLVLVFAEHTLKSEYVKQEWEHALRTCVPVVPFIINRSPDDLPEELGLYHAVNAGKDGYDAALAELLRLLAEPSALLGKAYGVNALPGGYLVRQEHLDSIALMIMRSERRIGGSPAQEVTALVGMGGIGKTTLAKAVCDDCRIQRTYPDGIVWIEMGQKPDLTAKLAAIGSTFGDMVEQYKNPDQAKLRLSQFLQQKEIKRLMVVLDDVWERAHLDALPDLGLDSHILITTRSERQAVLAGAQIFPVRELTDDQGVSLVARLLRLASVKAEEREDANWQALRAIVRLLSGHTLAIALAAGALQERGGITFAPTMLERLQTNQGLEFFANLTIDENDRNADLEQSLSLSYNALSPDMQRRFRALGVLAKHTKFDPAMAAAIWGDPPGQLSSAEKSLNTLSRLSLLTDEVPGQQYRQHALLHTYALGLLRSEGEEATVFERYVDYLVAILAQPGKLCWGEWQNIAFELPHIHHVGSALHERYRARLADAALEDRILHFLTITALYLAEWADRRAIDWLDMGLEVAQRRGDVQNEMFLMQAAAGARVLFGHYERAQSDALRALELSRVYQNRVSEANALNVLGLIDTFQDKREDALDRFNQALPILEAIGDRVGQARVHNNIGNALFRLGKLAEGLEAFEKGHALFEELGYKRGALRLSMNTATIRTHMGDYAGAKEQLEKSLPLFADLDDPRAEGQIIQNLGVISQFLGDFDESERRSQQALALFQKIGDWRGEAQVRINLGLLARYRGQYNLVRSYHERAQQLFMELESDQGVADVTFNLGLLSHDMGDYPKAEEQYRYSLEAYHNRLGDQQGEADLCATLALLLYQTERHTAALEQAEYALSLSREIGDPSTQGYALTHMGHALLSLNRADEAERC